MSFCAVTPLLLEIEDLHVAADGKPRSCKGVDLTVGQGESTP